MEGTDLYIELSLEIDSCSLKLLNAHPKQTTFSINMTLLPLDQAGGGKIHLKQLQTFFSLSFICPELCEDHNVCCAICDCYCGDLT